MAIHCPVKEKQGLGQIPSQLNKTYKSGIKMIKIKILKKEMLLSLITWVPTSNNLKQCGSRVQKALNSSLERNRYLSLELHIS